MERENFYILLELSLEPPETNAEVIWEAIQNKKAAWSRLRNHPTKGLSAQKKINLLPEIQRVMMNNELREKEVLDALEIKKQGKENKFSEIDRHIDILMGKGYVEKEETTKLAEIHGIELSEIESRVTAKKNEKLTRIDREIGIRIIKGYITEAEIDKIAKRHSMESNDIRQRVRCPIEKKENGKKDYQPLLLDKSIEKTIIHNLTVVNRSSLYDFLGLSASSDLNTLHEKAGEKKKELANYSKKDAVITAGGMLAGQCVTVFKSDESRNAYDISLAKARLAALDMDINVAAINGKIRHEYLDDLIKKAMEFGMDEDEASSYIQSYAKQNKLKVEKKPEKKRLVYIIAAASALAVVIIIIAITAFSTMHKKNKLKAEYQQVLEKVETKSEHAEKIKLLKKYIHSHTQNKHTADAKSKINLIQLRINTKEFEKILAQADQLIKKNEHEKAHLLYKTHLKTTNNPENKITITERIQTVLKLIDDRNFKAITTASLKETPDQKITVFREYLSTHPKGKYIKQVGQLISEMSNEYYLFIMKKLGVYEETEDWDACVTLCQSYVDIYDNSNSDQFKQLLPKFNEKIRNEEIFQSLVQKADQQGNDYDAAQNVFITFSEAYPDVPIKDKIQKEMERINKLAQAQNIENKMKEIQKKLLESNGRFIEKKGGVAIDTKTGLMWDILGSDLTNPDECVTYEQGKNYIENLTSGGYTDWRMPTTDELAGLYNSSPAFPVMTDKWFWTSKSHISYSDRKYIKVDVFLKEGSTGSAWELARKASEECGTALAVRKPK